MKVGVSILILNGQKTKMLKEAELFQIEAIIYNDNPKQGKTIKIFACTW